MRQSLAALLCNWLNKYVQWLNIILKTQSFKQLQSSTFLFITFKFVSITKQQWTAKATLSSFSSIILEAFCFELFLILLLHSIIRMQGQATTSLSLLSIILNWLKNNQEFLQLTVIKQFKSKLTLFLTSFVLYELKFCNYIIDKFKTEIICSLIRIIEIEIIHRKSHRCICFHLKFSVIVFFFIVSESCRICSSSKHCRSHSESYTCVMKTTITSNHFVFRTQSNDVSQICDFSQCVHSSQFWLFLTFTRVYCISLFHQLFSHILCFFYWNWTIWFITSIDVHCASEWLKQYCISVKLVCFFFSFCKK